jgi:hypothetical protein
MFAGKEDSTRQLEGKDKLYNCIGYADYMRIGEVWDGGCGGERFEEILYPGGKEDFTELAGYSCHSVSAFRLECGKYQSKREYDEVYKRCLLNNTADIRKTLDSRLTLVTCLKFEPLMFMAEGLPLCKNDRDECANKSGAIHFSCYVANKINESMRAFALYEAKDVDWKVLAEDDLPIKWGVFFSLSGPDVVIFVSLKNHEKYWEVMHRNSTLISTYIGDEVTRLFSFSSTFFAFGGECGNVNKSQKCNVSMRFITESTVQNIVEVKDEIKSNLGKTKLFGVVGDEDYIIRAVTDFKRLTEFFNGDSPIAANLFISDVDASTFTILKKIKDNSYDKEAKRASNVLRGKAVSLYEVNRARYDKLKDGLPSPAMYQLRRVIEVYGQLARNTHRFATFVVLNETVTELFNAIENDRNYKHSKSICDIVFSISSILPDLLEIENGIVGSGGTVQIPPYLKLMFSYNRLIEVILEMAGNYENDIYGRRRPVTFSTVGVDDVISSIRCFQDMDNLGVRSLIAINTPNVSYFNLNNFMNYGMILHESFHYAIHYQSNLYRNKKFGEAVIGSIVQVAEEIAIWANTSGKVRPATFCKERAKRNVERLINVETAVSQKLFDVYIDEIAMQMKAADKELRRMLEELTALEEHKTLGVNLKGNKQFEDGKRHYEHILEAMDFLISKKGFMLCIAMAQRESRADALMLTVAKFEFKEYAKLMYSTVDDGYRMLVFDGSDNQDFHDEMALMLRLTTVLGYYVRRDKKEGYEKIKDHKGTEKEHGLANLENELIDGCEEKVKEYIRYYVLKGRGYRAVTEPLTEYLCERVDADESLRDENFNWSKYCPSGGNLTDYDTGQLCEFFYSLWYEYMRNSMKIFKGAQAIDERGSYNGQ